MTYFVQGKCLENRYNELPEENEIIKKDHADMGIIYFNKPSKLNTITWSNALLISKILKDWETCKTHVVLKSNVENVFSAGGNIKNFYNLNGTGCQIQCGVEMTKTFHKLCYLIATYQKPFISIIDGLALGGTCGPVLNSRYSIVTEKTIFATPESIIGNTPETGNVHKLSKLNRNLGLFLGLTGTRLYGSDLWLTGLATHFVPSKRIYLLTTELIHSDGSDVDDILDKYQIKNCTKKLSLQPYVEKIDHCFSASTIEEIIDRLKADDSEWSTKIVKILEKCSPTALKMTKKAFDLATNKNLEECLKMEYTLIYASINNDLSEGVRAHLIDKDHKPVWKPQTLNEVTNEYIEKLFSIVPKDDEIEF